MQALKLSAKQLPASRFPERADVYLCDKCGTDITRLLHPGRAHAWRTLGPSRFNCRCGQEFVSGAAEWDDLSSWEKQYRLSSLFAPFVVSGAPLASFGYLIYLAVVRRSVILKVLSVVLAIPAAVFLALFAAFLVDGLEIVGSLYRTRISRRLGKRDNS